MSSTSNDQYLRFLQAPYSVPQHYNDYNDMSQIIPVCPIDGGELLFKSFIEDFYATSIVQQQTMLDCQTGKNGYNNQVTNTIPKPSSENTSSREKPKCKWSKKSEKLFFSFLENHKYELFQLEKTRSSEIKKKLWMKASAFMLERHGLEYSSEQCSIKWKNIKAKIKEGKIEFQYKPEDIEEIDPNSINETIIPKEIDHSKRKRKSELLNEIVSSRPVKQIKFIYEYVNE